LKLSFEKYQGTGNDFIMLDNREETFDAYSLPISSLCSRKFGIGADGVIVIQNHPTLDFHMIYFNPDGSQSFCGNGSRCAVTYAKSLGLITDKTEFLSTDGPHKAEIKNGLVELKMNDVSQVSIIEGALILDTGSPHYILFVEDVDEIDIIPNAREIRYNATYKEQGINVNYIQSSQDSIKIRTYERGVEGETLSCGTGVTAGSIANHIHQQKSPGLSITNVTSRGGQLSVRFDSDGSTFSNIYLIGPAEKSFSGTIDV
jgi:diaminopimelate epimerase